MDDLFTELSLPRNITVGAGSLAKVEDIVKEQNAKNVCFVVDDAVYKSCNIDNIEQNLSAQGINIISITSIKNEPTVDLVKELLKDKNLLDVDVFVAIGGGSVIDTAKILSACATNPDLADNPQDSELIKNAAAYLIVVPTTAGTGAEATPNAILLDEERQLKVGVVSQLMIAQVVILDSNLTKSMPEHIAVSTGVDALAHALESIISKKSSCFSELYGLSAIKLIFENLEAACNTDSPQARENMLLASFYAGVCLSSSTTCAVHAMAYPLSGVYHVPHGISIAMLLHPVIEKVQSACVGTLSNAYRACFQKDLGSPEENAAEFVRQLEVLLEKVGAVYYMSDYGVKKSDLQEMAESAIEVRRLFDNTPMELNVQDLVEIYKKVL